jgi:hypothetical protein
MYIGEQYDVNCSLANNGNTNLAQLKVCFSQECRATDLMINQKYNLSFGFSPDTEGGQELKITAGNKDVSKISFVHVDVYQKPEVGILVNAPESAKYDSTFNILFNFSSNSPVQNFKLELYDNNKKVKEWEINDFENQAFLLKMQGSELFKGMNNMRIVALYTDVEGKQHSSEKEFAIQLEKLTFWQSIAYFFARLFS